MYENTRVYVIIVAAGLGKRMAANLPKQFLQIEGKTIVERTVDRFKDLSCIDGIIVVTNPDYVDLCCSLLGQRPKLAVVPGGAQRQDSVYMGMEGLIAMQNQKPGWELADNDIILIHDGARPFVTTKEIEDVIKTAYEWGAAVDAVPTKDTVRMRDDSALNHLAAGQFPEAGKEGQEQALALSKTLDRSKLYNVQTPQGFRKHLLFEAYEKAFAEGFYGTDDGSLVERAGHPVAITVGDYANIKITTKEDLQAYQGTQTGHENYEGTNNSMESRIGTGFDVHRLVEGRDLILGGVKIPFDRGLLGHSDADVLTHALMDAMLGAAALGDIGKHFPDSSSEFAGISSIELLTRVKKIISEAGFRLGNADITVIAQKPKIAEYIPEMRKIIATTLGVSEGQISIKGTTTEKLGFAGREEGIACEAVCLLNKN